MGSAFLQREEAGNEAGNEAGKKQVFASQM